MSRIHLPASLPSTRVLFSALPVTRSSSHLGQCSSSPFPPGFPAVPHQPSLMSRLPGTFGTMKALNPGSLTRAARPPRLSRTHFPSFRLQPRRWPGYRFLRQYSVSDAFQASPSPSRLAATYRRIEFVILRTEGSLPVALHPASRRRSYLQLRGLGLPRHGLSPCCVHAFTGALGAGLARERAAGAAEFGAGFNADSHAGTLPQGATAAMPTACGHARDWDSLAD